MFVMDICLVDLRFYKHSYSKLFYDYLYLWLLDYYSILSGCAEFLQPYPEAWNKNAYTCFSGTNWDASQADIKY
jgi:hypothetical protein